MYLDHGHASTQQEQRQTLNIFPSQPMHVEPSPKGELGLVLSPAPVGSKMPSPDHHHHHHQQQAAAAAMEELAAGSRRQQQEHHLHLQHQQQQPAFATAESAGVSNNKDVKPLTKKEHKRGLSTGERDPKTLRRLAQNREAARKSRLRKKAYIQQLESSRIRLAQIEQELHSARAQVRICKKIKAALSSFSIQSGYAHYSCVYVRTGSALPRQQPPRRARHRRKRSRRHRWPQLRGGDVRRGVRAVAGGAQPAHVRAAGGAAAAPAGGGAADVRGELPGAPRRGAGHQGRRHQGRRLPPHLRRLEEPRRALLPLARRLPPLRGHQDGAFARGPADGAADRGGVRAAAIGGADGGGAEPGPGHPLPGALRHRRLRRAHLLLHPQRLQLHGPDGPRRPQAHHPRRLRQTGGEAEAADAPPAAPGADGAADGAVAARRLRLLPPPPRAQLLLGQPQQDGAPGPAAGGRPSHLALNLIDPPPCVPACVRASRSSYAYACMHAPACMSLRKLKAARGDRASLY
uniref:BZIP domain-containing protein n=1 Tax=Aegilops tauschii subsp. strangulata TaxID=200361 RepID=A0A453L4K1_AEGTS